MVNLRRIQTFCDVSLRQCVPTVLRNTVPASSSSEYPRRMHWISSEWQLCKNIFISARNEHAIQWGTKGSKKCTGNHVYAFEWKTLFHLLWNIQLHKNFKLITFQVMTLTERFQVPQGFSCLIWHSLKNDQLYLPVQWIMIHLWLLQ